MKRIAVISSGYFPVPAVRGGAVETLIENLIRSNEEAKEFYLTVYSTYNKDAAEFASNYQYTDVRFIKDKSLVEQMDKMIYAIAKIIVKSDKQMSFRYILHRIVYIINVAKQLKRNNYDYVIIENTSTLFWVVRLQGNRNKYINSIIYHLHNEVGKTFGCRNELIECSRILGVSSFVNDSVKAQFPEINENKFLIYHNCIDIERISSQKNQRSKLRKVFGIKDDDVVFIFVGRLCKDKGVEELLTAFSMLNLTNVKLMIVGNYYFGTNLVSDFEKHLHDMIEKKRDSIIFTGFVPNENIGAYYHCADVAVLPSIWDEPAGLTIIEAMAASLPVITTYSGGIPEYAGEGNAVFIDKNNSDFVAELKVSMESLALNKDLRMDLGAKAFIRSQKFDYKNYASNLNHFFQDL